MTEQPTGRLRIGLLGCGAFAAAALIPSLSMAPIDVVAVCDLDGARAEAARRATGAGHACTSLDEVLAIGGIDAVLMAVGPQAYPDLAARAMRAGLAVYVEKPVAMTVDEALGMRAVSSETGRPLAVGFMKRFATGYRMAKEVIDSPEFGSLTHVNARIGTGVWTPVWAKELTPFAMVLDHSIHYLDLVQFYAGPVEWVCAVPSSGRGQRFGLAVLLRFCSGATGLLEISNYESRGVPNERIQLMGDDGRSVTVENVTRVIYSRDAPAMTAGRKLELEVDRVTWEPNMTNISPENSSLVHMGYVGELRNWAEALMARLPVSPSIDDGIAALRLAHAVLASDGRTVDMAA